MRTLISRLRHWVWSHPRLSAPLRALWRAIPSGWKTIDGWSSTQRQLYRRVFDPAWYLADNPDVAASGIDPLTHYLDAGWKEARDPHPLFDVSWYLAEHADVRSAGIEPLQHYLQWGWREGWDPHPLFDSRWYLDRYRGEVSAEICPLLDYIDHGVVKGRLVHPRHRAGLLDTDSTPLTRHDRPLRWATVHQPNLSPIRLPLSLIPWTSADEVTIDHDVLFLANDRRAHRRQQILANSNQQEANDSPASPYGAVDFDDDVLEILSMRDGAHRVTDVVATDENTAPTATALDGIGLKANGSIRLVERGTTDAPGQIQVTSAQPHHDLGRTIVVPDAPLRPSGWAALRDRLEASARSAAGGHPSSSLMIARSIEAAYDSALLPTALVAAAIEEADIEGLDAVHYMSREGSFLARLHGEISDILTVRDRSPQPIHLALSRRSTFGPTLRSFTTEALMDMWRMYHSQSLRALIVSLGDDIDRYRGAAKRHRLAVDEVIQEVYRDPRVASFLSDPDVQKMLSECNGPRRRALDAYLDKTWRIGDGKIIVVDVGWRGTIQDNLARGFPNIHFTGWYLALFPFLNPQPRNGTKSAVGLDANLEDPYEFMQPPAAVERPWTPDVPSVVDYRIDPAAGAVPVEERELLGRTERRLIVAFQDAAVDAAKLVAEWIVEEGLRTEDLRPLVRSELARYYTDPPPGAADIWFSSAHDDTFGALNVTPFGKIVPDAGWLAAGLGRGFRAQVDAAAVESRWSPGYRRWLPVEALTHLERALRTKRYRAEAREDNKQALRFPSADATQTVLSRPSLHHRRVP